jgi:hypothetical protein
MQDRQCAGQNPHSAHTWTEHVVKIPSGHANSEQRMCQGVHDVEPGGLDRKQCEDTRPHRAHTWFNDIDCELARTALCEGTVNEHSCRSYVCDCVGGSQDQNRCDYRMLADAVIENFPTSDGDAAEVTLCVDAVHSVGEALRVLRTPPGDA